MQREEAAPRDQGLRLLKRLYPGQYGEQPAGGIQMGFQPPAPPRSPTGLPIYTPPPAAPPPSRMGMATPGYAPNAVTPPAAPPPGSTPTSGQQYVPPPPPDPNDPEGAGYWNQHQAQPF